MGTTSRQQREQEILDAADRLFGDRGFAGVSMRDVAHAAGLKKALVFYYFPGKEALFQAVLGRYYAAHRAVLATALTAEAPIDQRLHDGLDAYLDFIEANRRYPRLVQGVVASSPEHHPLIEQNLAGLYGLVDQAVRELTPSSGPLASRHLFLTLSASVINHFTYAGVLASFWDVDPLSEQGLAERRAHIHWLVDTLLGALRAAQD
jgi:TetR/AcrR family transcriptional regulator